MNRNDAQYAIEYNYSAINYVINEFYTNFILEINVAYHVACDDYQGELSGTSTDVKARRSRLVLGPSGNIVRCKPGSVRWCALKSVIDHL